MKRSTAAAVLVEQDHTSVRGHRHDRDRAGMPHDVALEGRAVRGEEPAVDHREEEAAECDVLSHLPEPRARRAPPSRSADRTDVDEARVAPFGTDQRRAEQLAKERVGLVGPALEFGVRLGPHPKRVAGQLDELDQTTVGREPRADQARVLQASAETRVDLVAVAVALRDDDVAVGVRPPGSPASSRAS